MSLNDAEDVDFPTPPLAVFEAEFLEGDEELAQLIERCRALFRSLCGDLNQLRTTESAYGRRPRGRDRDYGRWRSARRILIERPSRLDDDCPPSAVRVLNWIAS